MKKAKPEKAQQDSRDLEITVLKSQLARALADYDNLEKRIARQSIELYSLSSQRIVKQLLPILDMLNDSQKHLNDAGLAIIIKEFEDVLKNEGYLKIEPREGDRFDAGLHEAVDVVETDKKDEDNKIASLSVIGWMQGEGNIVRVAKVVVRKYKGKNLANSTKAENNS